jgi:hypothetical protein
MSTSANWQWTKWGMSLNEITVLQGKSVRETTAEEKTNYSMGTNDAPRIWLAAAVAPYKADAFSFNAYFLFKENKLDCVFLDPQKQEDANLIMDAIRTKYGPADRVWKPLPFMEMVESIWYREDEIKIQVYEGKINHFTYCSRDGNKGL